MHRAKAIIPRVAIAALLSFGLSGLTATPAAADPVQTFGTFRVQCGADTLVIVDKPGSSTIVTVNGAPSTGVNILMGITVTVDGVVVEEFHKPFTEHQDVTVCDGLDLPAGVTVLAETLITPRR